MSFTRLGVHCERVRMVNSTVRGFYHDCKHHGSQYVFSLHATTGEDPGVGSVGAPWRRGGVGWSGGDRRQAIGSMLPVPQIWRVLNPVGVPATPRMPHGVRVPETQPRSLGLRTGAGC